MKRFLKYFLIILIVYQFSACSEELQKVIAVLKVPADAFKQGEMLYINDIKSNQIYIYKNEELINKLPYNEHARENLFVADDTTFFLTFSGGNLYSKNMDGDEKYLDLDFKVNDFSFLNKDTLILLGLKDSTIFHLIDRDGNTVSDFGKPPEKLDHDIGLLDFLVEGDTIYVASINEYRIYRYIDKELFDSYKADRPEIKGPVREKGKKYRLSGINGIAASKDRLYVSTFLHKPINRFKANSCFTLDVFDKNSRKYLSTTKYDSIIVPFFADHNWLYLISGSKVIKRRK